MKKIFTFVVALVTVASSAMALDYEPKEGLSTQVFLGFNTSTIRNLDNYNGKIGGIAGAKFDYVLPKAHGTYVSAGLDWSQKGAKNSDLVCVLSTGSVDATDKINLHYLEIPIHVGFRYNFSNEVGVFGEIGPYFGIGIAGKHKYSVDADGPEARSNESSYKIFKKSTSRMNFQRWDAGIGFLVGAEYNQRYSLSLGCDWGLTDMYRDDYRDAVAAATPLIKLEKLKNFNFKVVLGYRF